MKGRILLIIDVQKYFMNDLTKDLPEKIKKYIKQNRKQFEYVIFTQFINNKKNNFVRIMDWNGMSESPDIDLCDDLAVMASKEFLFAKNEYSAFKTQGFAKLLKENNVEEIWMLGINTEQCVFSTAIEAFDLGYKPFVISQLCRSSINHDWHKCAIDIMKEMIGEKQVV